MGIFLEQTAATTQLTALRHGYRAHIVLLGQRQVSRQLANRRWRNTVRLRQIGQQAARQSRGTAEVFGGIAALQMRCAAQQVLQQAAVALLEMADLDEDKLAELKGLVQAAKEEGR